MRKAGEACLGVVQASWESIAIVSNVHHLLLFVCAQQTNSSMTLFPRPYPASSCNLLLLPPASPLPPHHLLLPPAFPSPPPCPPLLLVLLLPLHFLSPFPSLPLSLPLFLPPSLPPSLLPLLPSLAPSLPLSLLPSLPPSLPPSVPPSLPPPPPSVPPCRLIPIDELSAGQIAVLRKLALVKLTAMLELYDSTVNM